jgi:Domain of unknown function (DUF4824)
MFWYRARSLYLGLGLLMLTNLVVLSTVWYNRTLEPDSTLTLTDRELSSPFEGVRMSESSGLSFRLTWRMESPTSPGGSRTETANFDGGWLDTAKLADLGITIHERALNPKSGMAYRDNVPVEVLLVLELNGPAYQHTLARACSPAENAASDQRRIRNCQSETNNDSRLFVVDAGLDREALRNKYPDRSKYAIVHGQIGAMLTQNFGRRALSGYIAGLANDDVNVPLNLRFQLGDSERELKRVYGRTVQPFSAVVKFGRRLEPWLAAVSLLPKDQSPREP